MKVRLCNKYRSSKKLVTELALRPSEVRASKQYTFIIDKAKDDKNSEKSMLFEASFIQGKVRTGGMANQGAGKNLLSSKMRDEIKLLHQVGKLQSKTLLSLIRAFWRSVCEIYNRLTIMFYQKLRPVSNIIQKISYKVPQEDISSAILGSRVLESVGCKN